MLVVLKFCVHSGRKSSCHTYWTEISPKRVLWYFVHVCFVQVTILKLVQVTILKLVGAPDALTRLGEHMHFPTDICSVIQEGEKTVEKCAHRAMSARRQRHMFSLGRNKHGHNDSAPLKRDSLLRTQSPELYDPKSWQSLTFTIPDGSHYGIREFVEYSEMLTSDLTYFSPFKSHFVMSSSFQMLFKL